MGLVTLTFDRLILKLVYESHLRWGTFLPNLGSLGLWVLELFTMYVTDGQTDSRTDIQKQCLLPPSLQAKKKSWTPGLKQHSQLPCSVNPLQYNIVRTV